jgi:hypothetical protein
MSTGWPPGFSNEAPAQPLTDEQFRAETAAIDAARSRQLQEEQHRRSASNRGIVVGLILIVVGIVITAVTYASASASQTGGTYIVAYGPIAGGVISLFRGLASKA